MEVGRRFTAGGRPILGVRCVGFGWERWMTVRGGCGGGGRAMGGCRWSPLAGDAWRTAVTPDAGHWLPVRGRERVRDALERERERVRGSGGSGSPPDSGPPSPFCNPFPFFCCFGLNKQHSTKSWSRTR